MWLHGTKVRTAEDANSGTEFRFRLPGQIVTSVEESNTEGTGAAEEIGAVLREADVYVIEDSDLIRKTVIRKLKKAANSSECCWHFHEHATVESILPAVSGFVRRTNIIVTVDENLDSQGGVVKGTELITKLRSLAFAGILVSASGDHDTAQRHKALGADLAWGKPLPSNDKILKDLADACAAKSSKFLGILKHPDEMEGG